MTVTIWTHHAPREAHAPYPAYSDTHTSREVWGMVEHELERLAKGELCEVRVTNDGKSEAASRAQLDAEADAAERSEARLREMGG